MLPADPTFEGCSIPPEIYAAGMGWDPQPEIERLLFLAREAGVSVRTALELGCGPGRLLAPLAARVERVVGVELNPQMADAARCAAGAAGLGQRATVLVADMCGLALGAKFDLIFTSPNTLRHVLADAALERFWRGVAEHLAADGVFIADLELGAAHARRAISRPQCWTVAREELSVDVRWEVAAVSAGDRPRAQIRWTFCRRGAGGDQCWAQEFTLRVLEIEELAAAAARAGLRVRGVFENRDPYLLPRAARKLDGRFIVVLGHAAEPRETAGVSEVC